MAHLRVFVYCWVTEILINQFTLKHNTQILCWLKENLHMTMITSYIYLSLCLVLRKHQHRFHRKWSEADLQQVLSAVC